MILDHRMKIKVKFFVTTLLVISGLAWGVLGATGYNLISRFSRTMNVPWLSRIIYVTFGIASLVYLAHFYNAYNFVGSIQNKEMLPPKLLNLSEPLKFDREISLNAPDDAKYLIYWAQSPSYETPEPDHNRVKDMIYKDLANSGATRVKDNKAIIRIMEPNDREAGVSYRWMTEDGYLSDIKTVDLN